MSSITSSTYPTVTVSKDGDLFAIVRNGQLMKMNRAALEAYIQQLAPNTLISLQDTPVSYVGQQGKGLVVNATEDAMEFAPTVSSNFLALTDTPGAYGGQATKLAVVKADETGLEFIDNFFIALGDTPATYTGQQGNIPQVNSGETALQFSTPADIQTTGWAQYADTVYTSGSPFTVTAGTTVNLPNNAGSIIDSQLPTGVASFYDGTVIQSDQEFDIYDIGIRFVTEPSIVEGAIGVSLDIGGASGVIVSDSRRLSRGAGNPNLITISFLVYAGSTFKANGATVKFEAIAGNQDVYNINYVISRQHKAR